MDSIGTIAFIIAAITGIIATITGIIGIRNSKGNVIKRIERKQRELQELDNQFFRQHGPNANMSMHYPFWKKKEKLEAEIRELEKKI